MWLLSQLSVLCLVFPGILTINPVILIPGYGGSQAYLNFESFSIFHHIWVNYGDFIVPSYFNEHFRLIYDPVNHTTSSPPGVNIVFPGWGQTWSVENLGPAIHYFDSYANTLREKLGYKSNESLRGAPFEFRKAPYENEEFFVNLKALIEETYSINNNTRCFIVAHSMGNLYTMDFFNRMTDSWKKTYIRGFAAISPPFAGTVKTFATLAKGENFQVFFVNPLVFRETLRSFPSTHFMLPNRKYWNSSETLVKVIKGGVETNYHAHNLEQFYADAEIADGMEIYNDIQNYKQPDYSLAPSGVDELYCLYGTQVKTISQLIYTTHDLTDYALPDKILYGDGDGTVNERSLQVCNNWKGVVSMGLPGAEHLEILKDKRVLDFLQETLRETS